MWMETVEFANPFTLFENHFKNVAFEFFKFVINFRLITL